MIKVGDEIPGYLKIIGTQLRSTNHGDEIAWLVRFSWGEEKLVRKWHLERALKYPPKKKPLIGKKEAGLRRIFRQYKGAAKRRGYSWDLSIEQVAEFIASRCSYCGQEPSNNQFETGVAYSGIDRVDNELGYSKENCVSCCGICNTAKMDRTSEEFYKWIEKINNFSKIPNLGKKYPVRV